MKPLVILQVAYPLAPVGPDAVGGAEQVLSHIDRALDAAGHRSLVLAMEGSVVAGDLVPIPAEPGPFDDDVRRRAWAEVRAAIARIRASEPVDVVHCHGIDFPAYLPEDGPTLVTLHLPPDWYPDAAWMTRPGLRLHGVSSHQSAACPAGLRLLPPIPNGVPVDDLAAKGIAVEGHALVLGRICPEKGIHLAIESAERAGVPLVIAGRVYPYESHVRYFEEEIRPRLSPAVRFAGPLGFEDKRRMLASAACLLVPSLCEETSSLVAMEAAACGTPVVAFAAGALPEVVEEGRTGFLVEDVAGMAAAIPATAALDRELCRAIARERFSLGAMTDRYLSLYRDLRGEGEAAAAP